MAKDRSRAVLNESAYVITAIMVVFFMTERLIYPVLGALCVILCYLLLSANGKFRCPAIIIAFISFGALILLQMIVQPSTYFSAKIAVKELSRLCIYTLVVLIAANTHIREYRFLRLWKVIFLVSVLVAVLQFAKSDTVSKMLIDIYGDSMNWYESMNYSTLDLFRSGSVFINANAYATFILAVLAVFLAMDQRKTSSTMYATISSLIIAASLVLAGSRTGMTVASLMVMGFYLRGVMTSKGRIRASVLLTYTLFVLVGAIGIAWHLNAGAAGFGGARAFQIASGFGNSLAYKFETFRKMVGQFTATNMVIGMGPFETDVKYVTSIDFDLGYLVAFHGIVGCMLYACVLHDICRYRRHMPTRYSYFNRLMVFILMLVGLTGGGFFSLRTFTVLATMSYVGIVDGNPEPIQGSQSNSVALI